MEKAERLAEGNRRDASRGTGRDTVRSIVWLSSRDLLKPCRKSRRQHTALRRGNRKQTKTEEQAERLEEVSRSRGTGRDTVNEEEMNLEP